MGDLVVGQAVADPGEDLPFPVGQRRQDCRVDRRGSRSGQYLSPQFLHGRVVGDPERDA